MTAGEIQGKPANVTISGRVFTLTPISLREEASLWKRLEAIAHRDDEERNRRVFRMIQQAPDELRPEMSAEMVREIKRGDPLSAYAVGEARQTAEGIAEELFTRTRAAHAELKIEDFKALVHSQNAAECFDSLIEAIKEMNPNDQTP